MGRKNKSFIVCLFLFFFVFCTTESISQETEEDKVQTVEFCKLLENPDEYDQKTVRVVAVYRYGFEWSELYCLECLGGGELELEFGKSFNSLTKSKIRKKIKWSERGKTVKVVAGGKFYGIGANQYLKKFVADYFEKADVILNDSPVVLPDNVKDKADCSCQKSETK